jgi:uncharacterized protein YjbI with pentapeptide repeats
MADEKKRCQYTYHEGYENRDEFIRVICRHYYFATSRDPETGEEKELCIFHAPLEAKKDRLGLFWFKFWREFAKAKRAVENSSEEEKAKVTLDCRGFVFPRTGLRFERRNFPFNVDFGEAEFSRDAYFSGAKFKGEANFRGAKMSDYAWFREAKFSGGAIFAEAEFSDLADFENAEFSSEAVFTTARFEGKVSFARAEFSGKAGFYRATFSADADFLGAEFSGKAGFWWAEFSGGATFFRAKLTQTDFSDVDIRGFDFSYAKIGEYAQRISNGLREKGAEGRCALAGEARLEPVGSTDFSGANYNPDNVHFRLLPYSIPFGIKWFIKLIKKVFNKETELPRFVPPARYRRFVRTMFIAVDTSAVDWSKNPRLGRDIRYQQFLFQFWERGPLYKLLYFLWWATSRCGESFKRWVAWSVLLVVLFAGLYTYLPAYAGAPLITERQVAAGECPGCGDLIEMSNEAPATPSFRTALYFSVVTFTTLGFGDVTQTGDLGKLVVAVEVILGYLMLGGLIALFANKLVRRE